MEDEKQIPDTSETGDDVETQADHEQQSSEDTVDYKAQAEKYRKALERVSKAQQRRSESDDTGESSPDIKDIARQTAEEVLESFRREQTRSSFDDELNALSDNEDEKELIKLVYENKLKPSGFSRDAIKADLQEALLIANRPKFELQLKQRAVADAKKTYAESKQLSESGSASASGRKPPETEEYLSETDKDFVAKFEHASKTLRGE